MRTALRIHFTDADYRHVQVASSPDPMWEALLALHILELPTARVPAQFRAWRGQIRTQPTGRQVKNAFRMLTELAPPDASYFPDFLTPLEAAEGLEAGIDVLRSTRRTRLAGELRFASLTRPLPAWTYRLADGDQHTLDEVATAIRLVHDHLVAPGWFLVEANVRQDRLTRVEALDGGVDALLASLHIFSWAPPVLSAPYPMDWDIRLKGGGVRFIPSYFCHGAPVAIVDENLPPVVVYPIAHRMPYGLADGPHVKALTNILGDTRARILTALHCPSTTGRLSAHLGISASVVSIAVKALRAAGLADSAWAGGRKVHMLTERGRLLCAPGHHHGRPR
ncbi:winged helix-turn-helix domain-containing protein [Streptomyces sp. NPDC058595]|uniref:winged helix-turn-helix domain-containing protein n=1 Tax=Streptomyces sp. NPDC058595 TaxID=3346550 RepID=UPI003663571B